MSAVERFRSDIDGVWSDPEGDMVNYSDYAALESRNAELEAEAARQQRHALQNAEWLREARQEFQWSKDDYTDLLRRVDELETRVAMADEALLDAEHAFGARSWRAGAIFGWNCATEGDAAKYNLAMQGQERILKEIREERRKAQEGRQG